MDVLSVRNVYEDALRAKDKKAAIGADVTKIGRASCRERV